MTARAFLIRGLIAGLVAGLATFFVAHQVGEPHVETAIALEEAGAAAPTEHTHDEAAADGHTHTHSHGDDGGTEVSRDDQRTWGLLTATLTVGVALGGVLGLVAAGVAGRIGRLTVRQSTALVAVVGFVSFSLVPFLKYPATPPAVGDAATIGARTGDYFGFLLVSVVAAVLLTVLAVRLLPRYGAFAVTVGAVAAYLVVVVVVGQMFPTVNEVGDFPADVLWYFRRASVITLATTWSVLGVVLAGLLGRLQDQETVAAERKALAASL